MDSFSAIIGLWESAEQFAADVGVKGVTARQWRNRGNIPSEYWIRIVEAAAMRGFVGINVDCLAVIAQGSMTRVHTDPQSPATLARVG